MTSKTATVYVNVLVQVPIPVAIDEAEYLDWAAGPLDPQGVKEFLDADLDDRWIRGAPHADARIHNVLEWNIDYVELGRENAVE